MIKFITITFILLGTFNLLLSQQTEDINDKKFKFGLKFGPTLSKYIPGEKHSSQSSLSGSSTIDVLYEKNQKIGMFAGVFSEISFSKHFSSYFEYNFYYSYNHELNTKWTRTGSNANISTTIYTFSTRTNQIAILPKKSFGHQNRTYILTGIYFNFFSKAFNINGNKRVEAIYYPSNPIVDTTIIFHNDKRSISSAFGAVIGTGITFPIKKNIFSFELRFCYSLSPGFNNPDMKQIISSLNFIYHINLNKRVPTAPTITTD
jgi:hypothetical protein